MMIIGSSEFLQMGFGNLDPERIVAGLFYVKGEGYIFFEVGWVESFSKQWHNIGELIKEGKDFWVFKNDIGTVKISPIKEDDPLYDDAVECFEYSEQKGYQNLAKEFLQKEFGDKVEEVWVHK
jgi:hypothetical protein